MIVEILSTGDELLTGQVVDTNSSWLMDRLWELGIAVRRKTLVGDDRQDILSALAETTGRAEVVVMNGFSAHADQGDLLRFVEDVRRRSALERIVLVHGEPKAQAVLTQRLAERGHRTVTAPGPGDRLQV